MLGDDLVCSRSCLVCSRSCLRMTYITLEEEHSFVCEIIETHEDAIGINVGAK